jgi:hypothetical protein
LSPASHNNGIYIATLSRWRERDGVRVAKVSDDFPLTAAFPASGSRNPYLYIEERERHPVFLIYAKRNGAVSSPQRGEVRVRAYFLVMISR